MTALSKKQQAAVDAPLEPMAVIACAGSGKTKTAVQRLAKIRRDLNSSRSHVALLSFSNVAVDTFKRSYSETALHDLSGLGTDRVAIDTFDGFITNHILRPHAYRTMSCNRVPFLITGSEPFLLNEQFKFWYSTSTGDNRPVIGAEINNISIAVTDKGFGFSYRSNNSLYVINNGLKATKNLACLGAYTHELGKFWALKTLIDQPGILRVLANRYSHIIVDEAQDLGQLHQLILELLTQEGVKISLIGDPNQAIYEFAGATGGFINEYNNNPINNSFELDTNYRSIPAIQDVANELSGRDDDAARKQLKADHGAYYTAYDPKDHRKLVDAFVNKIETSGLSVCKSAVLYRGNAGIEKLRKTTKSLGQGKVKMLAQAAIDRDANGDYQRAFRLVANSIVGLLKDAPDNLSATLSSPGNHPEIKELRKLIWLFVRSSDGGLPHARLKGSTEWHTQLKERLVTLLNKISQDHGYALVDNIGKKLAKTKLIDEPLIPQPELDIQERLTVRVDTVHQAKGESLDAVLYMAKRQHIEEMLNGTGSEVGRIGYVAVTRARDLFVLGVPKANIKELAPRLESVGLKLL